MVDRSNAHFMCNLFDAPLVYAIVDGYDFSDEAATFKSIEDEFSRIAEVCEWLTTGEVVFDMEELAGGGTAAMRDLAQAGVCVLCVGDSCNYYPGSRSCSDGQAAWSTTYEEGYPLRLNREGVPTVPREVKSFHLRWCAVMDALRTPAPSVQSPDTLLDRWRLYIGHPTSGTYSKWLRMLSGRRQVAYLCKRCNTTETEKWSIGGKSLVQCHVCDDEANLG